MEPQPSALLSNRIRFLDALRGIAVLCIFIANIAFFSGSFLLPPEERLAWAVWPSDLTVDFICFALIDGKFYTIFSLLFGIGCAMQFQRMENQGLPFKPFFRRRMFWLLVIGAIHLCLIWLGDILALYAILGFVLLGFVHVKNKNLLKYAVLLLLLPIINHIVIDLYDYPAAVKQLTAISAKHLNVTPMGKGNMGSLLKNDEWGIFFRTNLSNTFIRVYRLLDEGRPFKVLGIFLIGLWAGRKIITENLLENTILLKKIAFWGICIGLPFCLLRAYIEFFMGDGIWDFIKTVTYAIGTVPLALGYAALLALHYHKNPRVLTMFEPVGKMALTNYLFQTFISIAIFYHIGFGLAGKLGFTLIFIMALSIFSLQLVASTLWLKKFPQGPVEWFWRWATK